ncbi:cystatin-A1-like [Anabas testudineus]|uniref:Cystatin-B n=1 Tax=Anabas testudineus TaxID=64144 RepID=A0A7N6ANY4_ANATE|nr:cystatin-A1-like [Anabas testudineus]
MATIVGGYSETKNATDEIQKYCDQVKHQVEGQTNQKFSAFKAIKYRNQVVQGMNYLIKIHVHGHSYIHVKVFHNLPCYGGAVELKGVKEKCTKDDPLVSF